jgi:hypothetical protein
MFDKIRLWWKYNGSYIPKNIVIGIKNLWNITAEDGGIKINKI